MCVSTTTHSPKLVSAVDVLLLEAESDWAEILVVGEVVPVLRGVEVFLVSLMFHGGQPELPVLLPLLFHRGFLLFPRLTNSASV